MKFFKNQIIEVESFKSKEQFDKIKTNFNYSLKIYQMEREKNYMIYFLNIILIIKIIIEERDKIYLVLIK